MIESSNKENKRAHKISRTMRERKINNFASYQKQVLANRPNSYLKLQKTGDLAELIGAVLGDGYIGAHVRTEVLRIACNANNPGFIERYSALVETVFDKKPTVKKRKTSDCVDIVIYQKEVAKRLHLKTGAKTHRPFTLPTWIKNDVEYQKRFLRGLFETDGCYAKHLPTYTYKFIFSNVNESLLNCVYMLLYGLGFHPTITNKNVQLSRKLEVETAIHLLQFRKYQ